MYVQAFEITLFQETEGLVLRDSWCIWRIFDPTLKMDYLLTIMQFQTFMPFVFSLDFLTAQEEQKIPNIVNVVHVTYVFRCLGIALCDDPNSSCSLIMFFSIITIYFGPGLMQWSWDTWQPMVFREKEVKAFVGKVSVEGWIAVNNNFAFGKQLHEDSKNCPFVFLWEKKKSQHQSLEQHEGNDDPFLTSFTLKMSVFLPGLNLMENVGDVAKCFAIRSH